MPRFKGEGLFRSVLGVSMRDAERYVADRDRYELGQMGRAEARQFEQARAAMPTGVRREIERRWEPVGCPCDCMPCMRGRHCCACRTSETDAKTRPYSWLGARATPRASVEDLP